MTWLMIHPEDAPSRPVYLAWLARFGLAGVVIHPGQATPASVAAFGGLLLTGGGDIEPGSYGAETHPATNDIDPRRDALERELVGRFVEAGKPIFGICRGSQILNVIFGGRMIQHVPDVVGDREVHTKKGTYDSMHAVVFEPGTFMAESLRGVAEVNSAHHQATDPAHLGSGIRVAARSGAGIVEAIECHEFKAPILAVQWHPERMAPEHPASCRMFESLLKL